jgi:hypothetical protein
MGKEITTDKSRKKENERTEGSDWQRNTERHKGWIKEIKKWRKRYR